MAALEATTAAKKSSSKGQAWFCTTGLPIDIVVEVNDMTFHLHKVISSNTWRAHSAFHLLPPPKTSQR
ncbi:BTB/POZ domain-containing protein [Pyrus ussuriensis x Pyrus communis]|uniref:BTB/POZ domain-containing protein n=1 Tax=Pyrus ussuriensis x Pyrus communis TaxID=2448454 RepID=A0A5N5GBV7_9ROSA|nr:BTB/POZ domain-containing protein [Pyrus ussuriensis x Pyrus communis]